ncbi:Lrp/AsnC family transcriptional regulator [Jannaschia donghaensis]|uniref:MarR family protein n=1 Tax=Jannaschia donghaensis TaxID=420998 RepID=A0A0M6YHN3_9RHOB|nr:MarR family protein [Jannaschia donghaensis]
MTGELDDTGRMLLALLGENGRRSVASLARALNLSRTAVQDRMGRLERDGWIEYIWS